MIGIKSVVKMQVIVFHFFGFLTKEKKKQKKKRKTI